MMVTGGPLLLRIDVCHRKHAAAKEDGDLVGVEATYFAYAYMRSREPEMAVVWDAVTRAGREG